MKNINRKARRKKEREVKKKRKADFNNRFTSKELTKSDPSSKAKKKSKTKTTPKAAPSDRKLSSVAEERDKNEIRRLEKLLRIRKKNKLPQSFSTDGLDCIFLDPK